MDEHIDHIRIVMEKLANANIKLNPDKCQWFAEKIKLLGHVISKDGIEMDKAKIEALKQRKPPNNVKELQSFLGFVNYYRKFIKGLAEILSIFYDLLKKTIQSGNGRTNTKADSKS